MSNNLYDIEMMLNKIDTQLFSNRNPLNYYNNRFDNPIMNDYSTNIQYDKYPNKKFSYNNNIINKNNNFLYDFNRNKEIEKEKEMIEDKISNGGYPNIKIEEDKITQDIIKEKNPYSNDASKI
jgi:hypothetical protein